MYDIPDHPVIRAMESSGYPTGKEPKSPQCPVCDAECDTIYLDHNGDYIGCENCVTTKDAWDVMEDLSAN